MRPIDNNRGVLHTCYIEWKGSGENGIQYEI
jgi:hypothetical protein